MICPLLKIKLPILGHKLLATLSASTLLLQKIHSLDLEEEFKISSGLYVGLYVEIKIKE